MIRLPHIKLGRRKTVNKYYRLVNGRLIPRHERIVPKKTPKKQASTFPGHAALESVTTSLPDIEMPSNLTSDTGKILD